MPNCPACNTNAQVKMDSIPLGDIVYALYKCGACDLHFWNPRRMPEAQFYERTHLQESKARLQRHSNIAYELPIYHKEFFRTIVPNGTMVDVGCGDGNFVLEARRRGFQAWGVDFDRKAIDLANTKSEGSIFASDFASLPEDSPRKYDVLTIFEVLEHQADPELFLLKMRELLTASGVLCGSVPNRKAWAKQNDMRWDSPPHHFTRWSKQSLYRFLSEHGFSSISISIVGGGGLTLSIYAKIASIFKRIAYPDLSREEFLVFTVEQLQGNKTQGKGKLLGFTKNIVKAIILPIIVLETFLERCFSGGRTLYFSCKKE